MSKIHVLDQNTINQIAAGEVIDRTFTAEGRKVRIVTAAGGGHSQIVIYN